MFYAINKDNSIKNLIDYRKLELGNRKFKIRKAPKMFYPHSVEREYMRGLDKLIILLIENTENILIPSIPGILEEANFLRPNRQDAYSDIILTTFQSLKFSIGNAYTEKEMQLLSENIAELTSNHQNKELKKTLSTMIGIDIFIAEPWLKNEMKGFVEQNVSLIKSIPEKYFSEIEEITFRGVRQGLTQKTISEEIQKRYKITQNRADLIARDQVGKFYGQLNMFRQTSLGLKEYIWRDVGDNRVRPSHIANSGKTFKWTNPPSTGHPGEDFQCRCYAEPDLTDFLK